MERITRTYAIILLAISLILGLLGILTPPVSYGLPLFLLGVVMLNLSTYFEKRSKWNNGICKVNGLPWEMFDVVWYTEKDFDYMFKADNQVLTVDPREINIIAYKGKNKLGKV